MRRQAGSRGSARRQPGRRGKEAGGRAGRAASSCPGLLLAPTTPAPDLLSFPHHRHSIQPPRVKPLFSPSCSRPGAAWRALPTAVPSPGHHVGSATGQGTLVAGSVASAWPLQLQHFCRVLSLWVAQCLPCC